jgi:hypothetical protein
VAFVFEYGGGRVFHSTLGHDAEAIRRESVANLLRRGTAWAAGYPPSPVVIDSVPIFNGRDLTGWTNPFDWGRAWVENGAIQLQGEKKFFLVSEATYGDFILELEVNLDVGVNSGIQFRSQYEPNRVWGPQADLDSLSQWSQTTDGQSMVFGIFDEGRSGQFLARAGDDAARSFRPEEWNKCRVECVGGQVRVFINGVKIVDCSYLPDREGHIGLQHLIPKDDTRVSRFRNIRIQQLRDSGHTSTFAATDKGKSAANPNPSPQDEAWRDLFNGRDLANWTPVRLLGPKRDQQQPGGGGWIVRDGELLCDGVEPGWLRTDREYSDFILQLEYKIPGQANSGVLIRCPDRGLPGVDDGMEIQLTGKQSLPGRERTIDANLTTGAIFGAVAPSADVQRGPDEWNAMEVRCERDDIEIRMNGKVIVNTNMQNVEELRGRDRSGFIGFFNWGGKARGTAFRNIRIKEL